LPEGWARIAPDLVVEVISPNDLAYEVDEKVEEYGRVDVPLTWVVNPHTRTVVVHRADGSISRLREGDELSGESVIPGFRCPVSAIFPPAPPPVQA
jgi:Uma2 family endonuclease